MAIVIGAHTHGGGGGGGGGLEEISNPDPLHGALPRTIQSPPKLPLCSALPPPPPPPPPLVIISEINPAHTHAHTHARTHTHTHTQLHKISEDADSRQQSLRLSQSHEELRGVTFADTPDKEEKQAKKPGFISRIFKRKTATPTLRKQSKWGRNRDSTVSESALMTTSKSMPEIARESNGFSLQMLQ